MWSSPPPPDNVLTDGRTTLPYAACASAFARLDESWVEANPSGATVLVDRRDLGTAVACLHALATRRRCYFWRPAADASNSPLPWDELPGFCGAALTTRTPNEGDPLRYDWEHRPGRPTSEGAKSPYLYLGTSGTTARPKLAAYTPERLLQNAANCVRRFELTPADRVLLPLPLAHMYGLGAAFLPAVLAGASVCLVPAVNVLTCREAEARFDPTVVFLTPGLAWQWLATRRSRRPYRLSVLGADRLTPELFDRYEELHGCTVGVYGSTETGAVAASHPSDDPARRRATAGPLMDEVRLAAAEPGDGDAPLTFIHPYGMSGYADEMGEPSGVDGDVYATQDLGRIDAAGDLRVAGRRDDAVKRDGLLVVLGDVERALERVPGIVRAVVTRGSETPRGRALVAWCVRQPGAAIDAARVRAGCRVALAEHAVPDQIEFLAEVPLTATGKPDRRALESRVATGFQTGGESLVRP